MSDFEIIDNTEEAKKDCDQGYGSAEYVISSSDLDALQDGKCLVLQIHEYIVFIYSSTEVPTWGRELVKEKLMLELKIIDLFSVRV